MNNPLREIFNNEDPEYKGKLFFETEAARNEFAQTIGAINNSEEAIEIEGIKKIEHYLESGKSKFQLDTHNEIIKLFVYPHCEDVPYEVDTGYGKYIFNLKRFKKEKEIVLKNDEKDVVHIRVTIDNISEGKDKMNFHLNYKLNPKNAENIEDIIKSYNAFQELLKAVTKSDFRDNNLSTLRKFESQWKRVYEIEKKIGINFNPANINDSVEDRNNIEEIYILLINQLPVRINLKDMTSKFTPDSSFKKEDYKIGSEMGLSFTDEARYTVFGETISFVRQNYIFNSVIETMDYNTDINEYTVKYVGTESNPLYSVCVGYLSYDDIPEIIDFNQEYERYSDAKTINEIISDRNSSAS